MYVYRPYLNAINIPLIILDREYFVQFKNHHYLKLSPFLPFTPDQLTQFARNLLPPDQDYNREIVEAPNNKRYIFELSRISGRGDIVILIESLEAQEIIQARKVFILEFSKRFTHTFSKLFNSLEHALLKFSTRLGEKTLKEGIARGKEILEILNVFSDNIRGIQNSEQISLKQLIEETVETILPIWKKRGDLKKISYTIQFQSDIDIEIKGSYDGLSRALSHIIRNSFEAMKSGGSIKISLIQHIPGKAICRIKDNGCGIPLQEQIKIFEPFYSYQKKGHSGLGLPFALGMIQKHYGKLSIENSSPEGTSFLIELPVLNTIPLSG